MNKTRTHSFTHSLLYPLTCSFADTQTSSIVLTERLQRIKANLQRLIHVCCCILMTSLDHIVSCDAVPAAVMWQLWLAWLSSNLTLVKACLQHA